MSASGTPPTGDANTRFVATIAYAGGALSGIVILAIEKKDRFVRFHAMQSTLTFLTALVAHLTIRSLPIVGPVLTVPLVVAVVVVWVLLMVRAFNGQWYKLPYLGEFADHLVT